MGTVRNFRSDGTPRALMGATGRRIETAGKTVADIITELVDEETKSNGDKISDYDARCRAQRIVFGRAEHRKLVKAYWADQNQLYDGDG